MEMIVYSDGSVWKVIHPKQAMQVWKSNAFEMFRLYIDDEAEGQIESEEEVQEAIDKNIPIGIEVGCLTKEIIEELNLE